VKPPLSWAGDDKKRGGNDKERGDKKENAPFSVIPANAGIQGGCVGQVGQGHHSTVGGTRIWPKGRTTNLPISSKAQSVPLGTSENSPPFQRWETMGSTVSFSRKQGQPSPSEPAPLDGNGRATVQIRSDCSDDLIQDRCQLMPFESFDSNPDDRGGTGV